MRAVQQTYGLVVTASPLTVTLDGSSTPVPAEAVVGMTYAAGDRVVALVRTPQKNREKPLVLGRLTGTPPTGAVTSVNGATGDVEVVALPGAWQDAELGAGWSNAADAPCGHRLLGDGRIELRGSLIGASGAATVAWVLPVTLPYKTYRRVTAYGGNVQVGFTQAGEVQPPTTINLWLDGVVLDHV